MNLLLKKPTFQHFQGLAACERASGSCNLASKDYESTTVDYFLSSEDGNRFSEGFF